MLYFLSLTRKCNLRCKYCGESSNIVNHSQDSLENRIESVIDFLYHDPDPVIIFYGGEPLLKPSLLKIVMDRLSNAKFLLQTNGLLLNRLDSRYLSSLDTILVSIDGSQEITDFNRGTGTFDTIRENLEQIFRNGFTGDLIARMTITHKSQIYEDVKYLMNIRNPSFNHIHWQLDAIWGDLESWHGFDDWVNSQYNPGITRLINEWIYQIKSSTKVLGIVPFIAIMNTLLTDDSVELRCGAGIDAFSIHTNGAIYACPVCPEFDDFIVGDVSKSIPADIYRSISIKAPCIDCEVYALCGGRCLFANHHNFWGDKFKSVCRTVKHLIHELEKIKPDIKKLIDGGVISINDFEYQKYNNSCEIIP